MSQLEESMDTIINVFHKYASEEGDPDTLNQKEFKQLVKKDMPNTFKKEKRDEKAINHMMEDLDTNNDSVLAFDEFLELVSRTLISKDKETHKNVSTHGHGHGRGHGRGRGHGHGHGRSHGPSYKSSLSKADHGSCDRK